MEARNMQRIQVYADGETKRRIELAAAKRHVPVTAYCLEAIMQELREDEVLEEEQIEISVKPTVQVVGRQLIARMRALRESIKARRGGELIGIEILEQVRGERDEELHEGIARLR